MSRVQRNEVAEDLVQDTFLYAVKSIGNFKGESSVRTWLTSILKNKIIDHYRKDSASRELSFSSFSSDEDDNSYFFEENGHWRAETAPRDWNGPLQGDLEKKEFRNFLQKCLAKLPELWRSVFSLKNMEDLDSGEICKELGISSSNYWVISHRSKLQLRDCLEKSWNRQA